MLISSVLGDCESRSIHQGDHARGEPSGGVVMRSIVEDQLWRSLWSWQAHLFGWPNSFLGLIAEPVVITVALAALGGVRFPRWFMLTAKASTDRPRLRVVALFAKLRFVISKLCPWCLLITVTTTLVFMSLTRVNILDGARSAGSQARTGPA